MKRITKLLAIATLLVIALAPTAQANDHDLTGVGVQIDNTIESQAFGFVEETPFGTQGPVAINDTIEFAECCDGFYAVDLTGNTISMRWIGDPSFARVIEPGTFDRYYFTFNEPVLAGVQRNAASTLPANITLVSATQMTVEIGPGMQVGDGFDVLIDVTTAGDTPRELAFTGVDSWQLAILALAAIAGGALLVLWSRSQNLATVAAGPNR